MTTVRTTRLRLLRTAARSGALLSGLVGLDLAWWPLAADGEAHLRRALAASGGAQPTQWPVDTTLTATAALLAFAALTYLTAAALLTVTSTLTGSATAARLALLGPPRWRAVVVGAIGAGLLAAPAAAAATDADGPSGPHPRPSSSSVLRGLPLPDRPIAWPGSLPPPRQVIVRPGDTLWGIAAARLPPEASARQITHSWHRWYACNAERIGADPNLITPGIRLDPPGHFEARTPK